MIKPVLIGDRQIFSIFLGSDVNDCNFPYDVQISAESPHKTRYRANSQSLSLSRYEVTYFCEIFACVLAG